jgi:hypothetical protein
MVKLSLLSLLSYELVVLCEYRYSAKAIIIIYHFIYEFTNKNNYCESGNEIITSSQYNYHYFMILITLSTLLLMSSSFIPLLLLQIPRRQYCKYRTTTNDKTTIAG